MPLIIKGAAYQTLALAPPRAKPIIEKLIEEGLPIYRMGDEEFLDEDEISAALKDACERVTRG